MFSGARSNCFVKTDASFSFLRMAPVEEGEGNVESRPVVLVGNARLGQHGLPDIKSCTQSYNEFKRLGTPKYFPRRQRHGVD